MEKKFTDKIEEVDGKIDAMSDKLTQVVNAILGNPLTKQGGFVDDLNMLKVEVQKLKDFKNRLIWTSGGIVALIIVLFSIIRYLTELIKTV